MEYQELKNLVKRYSDSYYKENISLISDFEFDQLMKDLEKMESEQGFADPDSPTMKPGSDLTTSMTKKHGRPMLSLENTYTLDEVESWYNKMIEATGDPEPIVSIENKFDGGSASIKFKNGRVIQALTRGDGEVGEDITQNVSLLDFSKISEDFSGEVRGELLITKSGFKELNKEGKYQNARNLLSGSMKLLDPIEFKQRAPYIIFQAYWLEDGFQYGFRESKTYASDIELLREIGFKVDGTRFVSGIETIKKCLQGKEEAKDLNYFEVDGAVMKLNDKSFWNKIGSTAKFPRWAKAFKFQQEEAQTTVESIEYQVGRSGKITPVCNFTPVFVDGSTISRLTLNNEDYMKTLDIRVGDVITVHKAAAIIPECTGIISHTKKTKEKFPTHCPVCGTKLRKINDEHADWYCLNDNCPARVEDRINNYTKVLEIDGFAEVIIHRLHSEGILTSIQDLYTLENKRKKLESLERFGKKLVDKLVQNVEASKSQPLEKLIAALGIRGVASKMGKVLAKHFKSMKVLMSATETELCDVEDIGSIVSKDIIDFFKDSENRKLIKFLEDQGVNMILEENNGEKPQIDLSGKTFCITGALSLKRDRYINLLESMGGKVVGAVSRSTSYLITNDKNSGSSKNKAAQQFGIPILSEKELLEMCEALELLKELGDF